MGREKVDAAKQYSIFTGLLIGFSITFTTILLTSSSEEIKNNIFFEYAIAAFVISAFTFLQSTEFFIDFTGGINDIFYDIASYCYYIGYLSMVLGIVYLLKLFDINYALWISYFFLVVSFIIFISDSIKPISFTEILKKLQKTSGKTTKVYKKESVTRSKSESSTYEKLIYIVCPLSIIIIYLLVVYFTLIK